MIFKTKMRYAHYLLDINKALTIEIDFRVFQMHYFTFDSLAKNIILSQRNTKTKNQSF